MPPSNLPAARSLGPRPSRWANPQYVMTRVVPFCIGVSLLGLAINAYSACTRPSRQVCPLLVPAERIEK